MHVALLANTAWLDEELATLHQLVVGLIDENVRVTQVLPEGVEDDGIVAFAQRFDYLEARKVAWRTRRRIGALYDKLREEEIDLVHVLDGRLWLAGATLSNSLGAAAVFSAYDTRDEKLATKAIRRVGADRAAFLATTQPLMESLNQSIPPREPAIPVALVRPGVHGSDQPHRVREPDEPLCLVVSGNGQYDPYYQALFEAAQTLIEHDPATQFFLDGQGSDQHELWKAAERHGLLANLSLIPRRLGHRELLLKADALIHPQPLGRARSLTLRAMAGKTPVLAMADPWLDYLHDGTSAWVMPDGEPTAYVWTQAIMRLHDEPHAGNELGQRASEWVSEHRIASTMVSETLALYRSILGEGIPFPTGVM